MVEMLDKVASEAEVNQLVGALKAADSRVGALIMTGRPVPVSWLGEGEAESVVDRWHKSRIPQQRQLVKSLLALALASAYGHPGPEWDRMGYPGPIDRVPDGSPGLEPLDVRNEGELSCDVVVVGSGAGGACVASELAQRGIRCHRGRAGRLFPRARLRPSRGEGSARAVPVRGHTRDRRGGREDPGRLGSRGWNPGQLLDLVQDSRPRSSGVDAHCPGSTRSRPESSSSRWMPRRQDLV